MKKVENMTVYVVDDNRTNLEVIKHKLRANLGCKVRIFTTAEECLRNVAWRAPDLVLSDYNLDASYSHKMNGDRMLVQLKARHPSLPVIMYSSVNSVDLTVNLMKRGAVDFIPRDERFLKRMVGAVSGQIEYMLSGYREQRAIAGFVSLVVLLLSGLVVVSYAFTNWLPYYVASALFVGMGGALVIPSITLSFKRRFFQAGH
ncbi:MAG: response regulator [Flavobacteriales bacterium]|nr:response regulator [Flavobacteriales bacterium]